MGLVVVRLVRLCCQARAVGGSVHQDSVETSANLPGIGHPLKRAFQPQVQAHQIDCVQVFATAVGAQSKESEKVGAQLCQFQTEKRTSENASLL